MYTERITVGAACENKAISLLIKTNALKKSASTNGN